MSSTQKSSFGSAKRVLATAASAAMIFALLPAGIALGESPDNVCPPPDGVETFPDVTDGVHADNIECLAGYDVGVEGYPDGTFRPGLDVFRAQMATFIVGLIEGATGEAMPAGENAFTDDDSSVHHANINKLAAAGVVRGTGGDNYSPARNVNRAAMASFVAQAIDYVDDQTVEEDGNSVLGAPEADHFIDDETSTHEDNINRLADHGIVEGTTATTYSPGEIVFRGQMASFVIEAASELEEQDLWAANDEAPTTPTTNQDFDVTPDEAAENTVSSSTTTSEGARQYSLSGLDSTKAYDIFLFPSENVSTDANDVVTFTDTNPNDNIADWTATDADIEVVNGTASGDTNGVVVDVSPVNGTISFTIDSTTADSVTPVLVAADAGSSDTNPDVDLNADNQPTEDFGVGGTKTWIPTEAATGTVTTDQTIASVNKDANRFITGTATYFYDSNDTFYVASGEAPCDDAANQVTMAGFEAELSKDDQIDGANGTAKTVYQREESLSSRFCLEDVAPAAPTATQGTETDTTAPFTVSGITSGATVTVYCGTDNNDAFSKTTDTQRGQTTTDQDANTSGFQVIATGLSPSTNYDCFITQTVDGEESGASTREDITTTATQDKPTIENAVLTTDSPIVGQPDSSDVWTITFNETMSATTATSGIFDLTDPDGDLIRVSCGTAQAGSDFITSATCVLSDSDTTDNIPNDRLTITLLERAEDRNAAGNSTSTTYNVSYPLTITSTTNVTDQDDGATPDLAASDDVVVDAE